MAEATSSKDGKQSDNAGIECPPDARRRKMPPEIGLNLVASSSGSNKKGPKKYPPPEQPTPQPSNQTKLVVTTDGGSEMAEMEAFADALDNVCGDEEIPDSTPENAPFDLVLDFMASVIKQDYKHGLTLATEILKYEPTNPTVQEYLPLLNELIQMEQEGKIQPMKASPHPHWSIPTDADSSCTSDDDEGEAENSSCSSSASSDSSQDENSNSGSSGSGSEDAGQSETSVSTVASDEYLSEYGEDYDHPCVPGDDGYESTTVDTPPPPGQEGEEDAAG